MVTVRTRALLARRDYTCHVDDNGREWDLSGERWLLEEQSREYAGLIVVDDRVRQIAELLGAHLAA